MPRYFTVNSAASIGTNRPMPQPVKATMPVSRLPLPEPLRLSVGNQYRRWFDPHRHYRRQRCNPQFARRYLYHEQQPLPRDHQYNSCTQFALISNAATLTVTSQAAISTQPSAASGCPIFRILLRIRNRARPQLPMAGQHRWRNHLVGYQWGNICRIFHFNHPFA